MPITLPVAMLIAQGVTTGAQVYSNRSANKAQEKAYNSQQQAERYALDQQLQLERERANEERRRYDLEQRAKEEEIERRKPFENMRMAALAAMAKMQGIDLPPEFLSAMTGNGMGQKVEKPFATAADIRTGTPPVGDARVSGGPSLLDAARGAQEQPQIYRPIMTPEMTPRPSTLPMRPGDRGTMTPMSSDPMSFLAAVKQAEELAQRYQGYFKGAR